MDGDTASIPCLTPSSSDPDPPLSDPIVPFSQAAPTHLLRPFLQHPPLKCSIPHCTLLPRADPVAAPDSPLRSPPLSDFP